jgi:hypothetical protein
MRAQHAGELLGVSGLMDDDIAHRPGFTPGTCVRTALLHRIKEGLPLRESVVVDLSRHAVGYTRRL